MMFPKSLNYLSAEQSDGEANFSEEENEPIEKVPIFPKTKFMHDALSRHRVRQRKQTRRMKKEKNAKEGFKAIISQQKNYDIRTKFQQETSKEVREINGNRIEGCWKNQTLHGYTEIKYESGQYFIGKYTNGVRTEGFVRFKDGTEYWGGFLKDLFHGKGSLKEPGGRILTTQWESGDIEGKVKIEYPSGDIYYGETKDLKKHGKGYIFFQNGNKYVGSFDEGAITGLGAYYQGENLLAEGIWKDGVLQIPYFTQQILLKQTEELGLIKPTKRVKINCFEEI